MVQELLVQQEGKGREARRSRSRDRSGKGSNLALPSHLLTSNDYAKFAKEVRELFNTQGDVSEEDLVRVFAGVNRKIQTRDLGNKIASTQKTTKMGTSPNNSRLRK